MLAKRILLGSLAGRLDFMHARRRQAFLIALFGLIDGGLAELTSIGRHSDRRTSHKHRIKAADRLVGNPLLHDELLLLWRIVCRILLGRCRRVVLLVDWTKVGAYHWVLSASVPIDGRAMPVFEMTVPESSLATPEVHELFLDQLAFVLPVGIEVVVVTDAGFESPWFDAVSARGWWFIGRIRRRALVRELGSDGEWFANKALHAGATATPEDLGLLEFPQSNPRWGRFVRVKDPPRNRHRRGRRGGIGRTGVDKQHAKSADEPWLLATSLVDAHAATIVSIYRMRMRIEEHFRDAKNERWGFGLGRIAARPNASRRIDVLLLLVALATLGMVLVGLLAQRRGWERLFQANTVRNRRVLSTFVLGTIVVAERARLPTARAASCLALLREQVGDPAPFLDAE